MKDTTTAESPLNGREECLSSIVKKRLLKDAQLLTFSPHEYVYREGDPADYICYIKTGQIKLSHINRQGKEDIIRFISEDDFIWDDGFLSQGRFFCSAIAMTEASVCRISRDAFLDTLKNQILTFLQMIVIGVMAWLTLRTESLFSSFGFGGINYGFAVILIMNVEFALLSPLFGMIANFFSRRAEYRADAQAVKEGYGKDLVSALKKLSNSNLADLSPSPLLVRLTYSHPTLSQRIEAIDKLSNG